MVDLRLFNLFRKLFRNYKNELILLHLYRIKDHLRKHELVSLKSAKQIDAIFNCIEIIYNSINIGDRIRVKLGARSSRDQGQ